MAPFSVLSDGIVYLDDGGAAKSSDRLKRRRRRRLLRKLRFPVIFGSCFLIFCLLKQNGSAVKDGIIEQRRKTNQALNKLLKKTGTRARPTDYHYGEEHGRKKQSETNIENERKYRWTTDIILPPLRNQKEWARKFFDGQENNVRERHDFKVIYGKKTLPWEPKAENVQDRPPKLDYTKHNYEYPEIIPHPPRGGSYPAMETLGQLLKRWPQNELDTPPSPIVERLQHFDFNDPEQLEVAERYRDLEFPFKLSNVPELIAANAKWTDDYLSFHFDRNRKVLRNTDNSEFEEYAHMPSSEGHAQESVDSFFAFFTAKNWNVNSMGGPPTKDNDFTYERWARHARYADSVGLEQNETHYYWQSGASPRERHHSKEEWAMISVDLPSFSDPEPNFISFNPKEQKGIQCRFGERGVAAATHYDGGRNMVGMITGAKRYVLAPPRECGKVCVTHETLNLERYHDEFYSHCFTHTLDFQFYFSITARYCRC